MFGGVVLNFACVVGHVYYLAEGAVGVMAFIDSRCALAFVSLIVRAVSQ